MGGRVRLLGLDRQLVNPFLENQKANTPLGRFATGTDVANAVHALADTLTFSTGGIITVDGGRLLK